MANGNKKYYITLYNEFCFHHIGKFLQRCKNLSDIMEAWYQLPISEKEKNIVS